MLEKNNHQNIQKIKDKNAEKNINSQKNEIVPVFNMFKMLPQAKFKLKKTEKTPPIPILTPGNQPQSLIHSKTKKCPKNQRHMLASNLTPKQNFPFPK